jgi:hypothetical protein
MIAKQRVPLIDVPTLSLVVAMALSSAWLVGCDFLCGEERQEQIDVTDAVERLVLTSGSGDISVEAADTDVVTIDATIRGSETTVDHAVAAGELRIETNCHGCESCCMVDYVITVPRLMATSLETGSGDVRLVGAAGDAVIETGSGDVAIGCLLAEELSIDTGSGDIDGSGLRVTDAVLSTGSGSVELQLETEPSLVDSSTGSGDILLEVPASSYAIDADTGSGEIDVVGLTVDDASSRALVVETGSGDIRIQGR